VTLDLSALNAEPDAETRRFVDALRAQLRDLPATHEVPVEQTRRARAEGRGLFPAAGPSDAARWLDAPTPLGRVRLCAPDGPARGVYLHIHGGGWTFGAPEQSDDWNLALARASGLAVVSVPYRLAPEHPWPACAEDVLAAARWLLDAGPEAVGAAPGGARWLAVGGESAGGHLAMVVLRGLRAEGRLGAVAGGVINYGCLDLRGTPSLRRWGAENLILSTPVVDWFVDNLTAGRRDLCDDPALSPLLGDLTGLPPLLVQCGTLDPLLDDSVQLATGARAAGCEAALRLYPGGVHAFDRFHTGLADKANAAVAAFLAERIAGG
jgi:acetyl esterase/lipase